MATVKDYTFQNMARIGNDPTELSESDLQSVKTGNYLLTNHFSSDCNMNNAIDFALTQPNVNFKGTHHTGMGGCNIDDNSTLIIEKEQSREKDKLSLQQRSFLTVPYLGRGQGNSDIESGLIQGDSYTNRKSINPSSEVSYIGYSNYPLIPSIEESVANPENLIEASADENWIRGGLPSRDLVRDNGGN
jgi:hypothetical protein